MPHSALCLPPPDCGPGECEATLEQGKVDLHACHCNVATAIPSLQSGAEKGRRHGYAVLACEPHQAGQQAQRPGWTASVTTSCCTAGLRD